ncbi:MAG: hypothetical protein ACYDGN_08345 [Acidimicrobiales bacterium]
MANRMDIELTSARDDETYTWRAAGARQPRGVVSSSVLPPHPKVGDVLRAEVEIEIDGITVLSVLPPKQKGAESNRIEFIGPPSPTPGVTTVLAGKPAKRSGFDRDRRSAHGEGTREGQGRDRDRSAPSGSTRGRGASDGPRRSAGRPGASNERDRASERPTRDPASQSRGAPAPGAPSVRAREATSKIARRGPQRFEPGSVNRDALFESLTPEQRPVAERLAAGGMPAVRKALTDEQQRARAEGRPATSGEPIIAMAEELLGEVKAAVWLDRAEAAVGRMDEIALRDLRATVVGAVARDERSRGLERQLRAGLERRVAKLRHDWEEHLTQAIDGGRVLQALRLSARPPEPTARFPGSLVMPLAELAGQAMTEETATDRWLALLEASVQSPVRRQIKPAGLPKDPTGEVERQARGAAGRIPVLARLLGMAIPPPPKPVAGERPLRPPRRMAQGRQVEVQGSTRPPVQSARGSEDVVASKEVSEAGDEP